MFWHSFIGVSFLKLLFWPCYTSTDFEVHRNWLAITHSLPTKQWYTESTSEWTLDYPPFFAWFEWLLSQFAKLVDPGMLDIGNLNYRSFETVLFQRLSIVVSDLSLAIGLKLCERAINRGPVSVHKQVWPLLVIFNGGLLLVDHVHFQYNGFLFGMLLASIGLMISGNHLLSAAVFVVLLNLKHIFLYCSPAYFVYLLFSYCFTNGRNYTWKTLSLTNLVKLGSIVIALFGLSLGPFIAQGQLFNVIQRLFPFKRGLTHAYWAPNFWAIYNAIDLVSSRLKIVAPNDSTLTTSSLTGGLVHEATFAVLPNVPPLATFILTLCAQVPCLMQLIRYPGRPLLFVRCLVICAFASFLFGWHVHEKAILMVIIPFSIVSQLFMTNFESNAFFLLSSVGTFSLLPLAFEIQETMIKVGLLLTQVSIHYYCLQQYQYKNLSFLTKLYLLGLIPVFFFEYGLTFAGLGRFEFLPLLLYSTYSSIGVISSFFVIYKELINIEFPDGHVTYPKDKVTHIHY